MPQGIEPPHYLLSSTSTHTHSLHNSLCPHLFVLLWFIYKIFPWAIILPFSLFRRAHNHSQFAVSGNWHREWPPDRETETERVTDRQRQRVQRERFESHKNRSVISFTTVIGIDRRRHRRRCRCRCLRCLRRRRRRWRTSILYDDKLLMTSPRQQRGEVSAAKKLFNGGRQAKRGRE